MGSFSTYFEIYQHIFLIDFLRYFIPASAAFLIFWKVFRKPLKHRFIQKRWPSNKRLWSEFKYSIGTVAIFATIGVGIYLAKENGYTQLYDVADQFGNFYMVLSFIIMVLFHDMYFYWTHRWMHHPKVYRYVHKVHHKSTNPSPWAAYSFHPLEAVVQAMVFPILIFTLPVYTGTAFAFLLYMILRNVWGHLGFELFPKRFMERRWINWHTTTTHHNMHHEHFNYNYGLYFTWWDKWFGTEHESYKERFEDVTHRKPEKSKVIIALFLFSFFGLNAQTPEGRWMTFDERTNRPLSIIQIFKDHDRNTYHGKIDSILIAPHLAENGICTQCEGNKKDQPIIGMELIWGFEKNGDTWKYGEILDPETGSVYTSKIWLEGTDDLYVRGYAGLFNLFYRTQKWTRLTSGNGIEGVWTSIDDRFDKPRAHVELRIENGELKGYVRKVFLLPHEGNYPLCSECEDDLKNQPIVGMKIMSDYRKVNDRWIDGTVLDPGNGTKYSSVFWLQDEGTLHIRGYWGPFYRTQVWRRIQD